MYTQRKRARRLPNQRWELLAFFRNLNRLRENETLEESDKRVKKWADGRPANQQDRQAARETDKQGGSSNTDSQADRQAGSKTARLTDMFVQQEQANITATPNGRR